MIRPHIFLILICQSSGNNDIRQMTEFSPQLDTLIEKPNFGGKVHVCADGRTMWDGSPRSVSIPKPTLMAPFSAFPTSAAPRAGGEPGQGWLGGFFLPLTLVHQFHSEKMPLCVITIIIIII